MAKVVFIIAQEGFRDEELLVPKKILLEAGHEVYVASMTQAEAHGSLGAVVHPDYSVETLKSDEYDAIVVVGGPGSPTLSRTDSVLRVVREMYEKGKVVAAICLGPMTLAAAGVLKGKRATVFPAKEGIEALKQNGADYSEDAVVIDGMVITANGPSHAERFGKAILDMLK